MGRVKSGRGLLFCMSFDISSTAELNNGIQMPRLGLGVYQIPPGKPTVKAVKYALQIGYRHIDTAMVYGNESDVGKALRNSDIKREDVFITTKVWNSDQGYDSTLKAFESSLKRLSLSYVNLYLIHWPVERKIVETWKAMITLLKEGKVHAIGVSNYSIDELKKRYKTAILCLLLIKWNFIHSCIKKIY